MAFEKYNPDFKTAEEVQGMLTDSGFFEEGQISLRSVVLALEVLDARHSIGKGATGYEISSEHLPVLTQYIERDEEIICSVDVS